MKKEKKISLLVLCSFCLASAGIRAQQQDSLATKTLDEVVVTATKFSKSTSETGKVLAIITEEQMAKSGGKDLSQILNEQAGIVVNGATSNPGKDKALYLRGAKNEHTLILVDGMPVYDPSGIGGAFDLRLFPTDQIERIEILKGSQSTLYGTDAIAGVINLITKKKGEKPLSAFGNIAYGSYNTFKGTAGVRGSLANFDYNASYTRYQADGVSEASEPEGIDGYDKDGFKEDGLQLNLGFGPLKNLSLRPFFRYSKFSGDFDADAFTDDTSAEFDSRLVSYGLNSQWDTKKVTLNLLYNHGDVERNYSTDFYTSEFSSTFDNIDLFGRFTFNDHVQLLAGIQEQAMKMDTPLEEEKSQSFLMTSPYISIFFKNYGGFYLELGGRYVNHSEYGSNGTYSINPSYLIDDKIKIFANYSTGFKTPTLSQLYGRYGANRELKPEVSANAEAGIQYMPSVKADFRAVVFSRKIEDAIHYLTTYVNLDEQNDKGFELESNVNLSSLSLRAFYAFVDGEVTTEGAQGDTTYYNLFRRPKHSFGINIGYQVTPALFASVNLKTFGERKDLFFDPAAGWTQTEVTLDAYNLVDVYVEYRLLQNKVRLYADVRNVLNEDFQEVYGYNSLKFNAMLGAAFNF